MGTAFLNSLSVISTNDCCTVLRTCLEKVFQGGSAEFTTENFKSKVCLRTFHFNNNISNNNNNNNNNNKHCY